MKEIRPGTYSLAKLQRQLGVDTLTLGNHADFTATLKNPTQTLPEYNQRARGLQEAQSSETLRPFAELLANSLDYGEGRVTIYMAETESNGWSITIGDKPTGTGMSSQSVLNDYFDPLASGSAKESINPKTGKPRIGTMGAGAQSQFGLLQREGDTIIVSSGFGEELTVAAFTPISDDVQVTIAKKQQEDLRQGVTQTIILTKETCQKTGLTPDSLRKYLTDRFELVERDITLKVIRRGELPQNISEEDVENVPRSTTTYSVAQETPDVSTLSVAEKISVAVSPTKSSTTKVSLNILGVRFGEPIIINGVDLPQKIDLKFLHRLPLVTEGRTDVALEKEDIAEMGSMIKQIEKAKFVEDPTENVRLQISVLQGLQQLYEQKIHKHNNWAFEEGHNISPLINRQLPGIFRAAKEKGVTLIPKDLKGIISLANREHVIYVEGEEFARNLAQDYLAALGAVRESALGSNIYRLALESDEDLYIDNARGVILVNQKIFPEANLSKQDQVRILALIEVTHSRGSGIEVQKTISQERATPLRDVSTQRDNEPYLLSPTGACRRISYDVGSLI